MFQSRIFKVLITLTILLPLTFSVTGVTPAHAATLIVYNSNDSGSGSLRAAIASAASGDIITFDSALSGGQIYLDTTLTLSKNVTIDGSSLASQITVSGDSDNNGAGNVVVFYVNSGIVVTLKSLIITKGTSGYDNNAGGIYNAGGTLTVENSTITGNSATWGGGAGIFNEGGTLTVTNSTVSNNFSEADGGGIFNDNILTVTNSTFSGNSSNYSGGGIGNDGGAATVTNSTFSGNSAAHNGGGIANYGTLNYSNTIIANSSSGGDCYKFTSATIGTNINNLVENGSCSASKSGDPKLATLANNGGATTTFALLAGSIAINAGSDAVCTATPVNNIDQRGIARPQGAHCDIGAYEFINGYSISGRAVDSNNAGISDVSISNGAGYTVTTDSNGNYALTNLVAGTYTITPSNSDYKFSPASRTYASLNSSYTNQNFTGSLKPPLILVHGFAGFDKIGFNCNPLDFDGNANDVKRWNGNDPSSSNPTLGNDLPNWLEEEGYQVWIAHLKSSKSGTSHLWMNALCLKNQINHVYSENRQKITLVAHSMGGLVSRAAILYTSYAESKISALYTLGSPHAGLPNGAASFYGMNFNQDAVQDMAEDMMNGPNGFNKNTPTQENIKYYFIGGAANPCVLCRTNGAPPIPGELFYKGDHDGLVSSYSAVGWIFPDKVFNPVDWTSNSQPKQYWTDESHISGWGDSSYYTIPGGDLYSYSFECMKDLLKGRNPDPLFCQDATEISALSQDAQAQSTSSLSAFTELKNGHLNTSQSISIPLEIDTNTVSLFYLTWDGDDAPTFTLTRPDSQVINPAYALAHTSEVTYGNFAGGAEMPPSRIYKFSTTQIGDWNLNITAVTAIDYQAFAVIDSSRSLTVQTDSNLYQMGGTAVITANLANGNTGLTGATVTAKITNPNTTVSTVQLTDLGNGIYSANYPIPNNSGYLTIDITASGLDGSIPFTRHKRLLAAIQSNNLNLTGVYGDTPNDGNADTFYESLDITAQITLTSIGEYVVAADLYAGSEFVTHTGGFLDLAAGPQTITLSFDGVAIRKSMLNGPYTVKNLSLTPLSTGITAQSATDVITTAAYDYIEFGAHPCYLLTFNHNGSGSDPVASPTNSEGCNADEYKPNESISLTASPATGWVILNWVGTGNDTSTETVNTLTMPAGTYSVTANYNTPPTVAGIVRANANPTTATSVDFTVTFSEPVTGVDAPDFRLVTTTGTKGATITNVLGTGASYTVSVNTGGGIGTIRLDVIDNDSIHDVDSTPLGGVGMSNGNFKSDSAYAIVIIKPFTSISANDGWTLESKENSNIANAKNNTGYLRVGDDKLNKQYRSFLYFDTASLHNNAVITKAIMVDKTL